jgi:hypothetical protein
MSVLGLAVRLGGVAVACGALIIPGAAVANAGVAAPSHKGILPPHNPSKSLPPSPFFLGSADCRHVKDGPGCNRSALKAIAHARKVLEKITGMSFSIPAYEKLSPIEQLFASANLERTERGLAPAVVLTRSLDKVAQVGAAQDTDPPLGEVHSPLPGGGRFIGLGANWAGGYGNALGSDYGWMYDDGLGSGNEDCTKTDTRGCWGHRDNILGTFSTKSRCGGLRSELAMGAGHIASGKSFGDSETELFAGVCGPTPTDVVITWARVKNLLHVK